MPLSTDVFMVSHLIWQVMSRFHFLDIVRCRRTLGEGVLWTPIDQCVWWTDIPAAKLYRYSPTEKQLDEWVMPEPVGSFAFVERDSRLILALATGFAWFDLESGRCEWIARPELEITGNRFNDGRRSEEHTSELQSRENLVCRLLLEKKNTTSNDEDNEESYHRPLAHSAAPLI